MFLRDHQLSGFETVSLSGLELTKLPSNAQRFSSARGYVITQPHALPCSTFYMGSVLTLVWQALHRLNHHTHTQYWNIHAGKISINIK